MVELRRAKRDASQEELTGALNRLIGTVRGDHGGRVWLLGDSGTRQQILGGAPIDTLNYPLRVRSAIANHVQVTHSSGSPDVLRVQDSGVTLSTLVVTSNATVGGTLGVTGQTTLSTLVVTSNATVGGTLGVTGQTTLSTLVVTSNATVGGTLGVTGQTTLSTLVVTSNATVGGTLGVTGQTTLSTLVVTSNATVGGTLGVTGQTTLTGALVANGNVTLGDATTDLLTINATAAVRSGAAGTSMTLTLGRTAADATVVIAGGAGQFANSALAGDLVFRSEGNRVLIGASALSSVIAGISGGNPTLAFFDGTPSVRQAIAAAATDLPTVIALANDLRTKLRTNYGLFS